jgi:hypothetical protein
LKEWSKKPLDKFMWLITNANGGVTMTTGQIIKNLRIGLIAITLIIFVFLGTVKAQTAASSGSAFFVRPVTAQFNGDGKGSAAATSTGQTNTAWKGFANIKWGSGGVTEGSTLVLIGGETYKEQMTIGASGSVGKPIKITVSGLSPAVIDCENVRKFAFNLNGKSNITIDGIRGDVLAGDTNYRMKIINLAAGAGGIYTSSASSNIKALHLDISGNQTTALVGQDSQGAIRISGGGSGYEIAYCWIHGPSPEPAQRWAAVGIMIWAKSTGTDYTSTLIHHNKIENTIHDAIKTDNNASIYNNEITKAYGPAVHADNIVAQSANYVKIYSNNIHDNDACQTIFVDNYSTAGSRNIYIYDNVINNPDAHGIVLAPEKSNIENVYIENNNFISTKTGHIRGSGYLPNTVTNLNIKNNKFGPVTGKDGAYYQVVIRTEWVLGEYDGNTYSSGSPQSPKVSDFQGSKRSFQELQALTPKREANGFYK